MRERFTGVWARLFAGEKAKRNIILLVVLVVAASGVYYKYFKNSGTVTYEYATATVKDLQKTVEGSGTVVSLSELNIQQLQNGGKVIAVYVKPGDYVSSGQIIAQLDNRQAAIQLAQARASYDKIVNGATKETIDISKQSVVNAQTSYNLTKQTQDTAVATAKRTLLNSSTIAQPVLDTRFIPNSPTVSGSYNCDTENEYKIQMNTQDQAVVTDQTGLSWFINFSSVPQAIGSCGLFLSFDVSKSYAGGEWKIILPNKTATTYSTNLNSYNIALQNREQALINASTTIINASLSYNQTIAGARAEDIASAKATLASAELNYENTIVRAPFAGQIGSVSAAVGQQTNSQAGIATIITKDKIAEVKLNEIDIVNVKLGQSVDLSFDAIPGEKFKGAVSQIDTVGLTTSNVVSFAVKISIPDADERIKSGMSVTAEIIIEGKEKVLTVPSAAIKTNRDKENQYQYVEVKAINNTSANLHEKVKVTTGMTNDVDTEVVAGLQEGDKVLVKTNNSGAAVKQTTSAFSLFGAPGGGGNRNFGGGGQRGGGQGGR